MHILNFVSDIVRVGVPVTLLVATFVFYLRFTISEMF